MRALAHLDGVVEVEVVATLLLGPAVAAGAAVVEAEDGVASATWSAAVDVAPWTWSHWANCWGLTTSPSLYMNAW